MTEILFARKTDLDNLTLTVTGNSSSITAIQSQQTAEQAAWAQSTPAVTAGSGALTTASSILRVLTNGKTVFFNLQVTITTNGTGATNLQVTFPNVAKTDSAFFGKRTDAAGIMVVGKMAAASGVMIFTNADATNTYPGANGTVFVFNGTYEAQ